MNISRIVRETDAYNFHSHTPYCDGRHPMRDMAVAAVGCGMKYYAFTPHSPVPVPSSCNMEINDVSAFLTECESLRREFAQDISLCSGMEIDRLGAHWGPHINLFADMPLKVRIGSVHFVGTQSGELVDCDGNAERFAVNLRERFSSDLRYVVEKYFESVLEMIAAGGFDILGHFDKIAGNASAILPDIEDRPWYSDLVYAVLAEAKAHGCLVEINTKAYETKGRFFPSVRWWPAMLERGLVTVVNSDAHYKDRVNLGREKAFEILRDMQNHKH